MKFILNYFSSVKLAITLLIIITLASILGTLVPQHRTEAEYAMRYGQLSPLLIKLEVTDLYHSWWYMGLLFLFSLNTAVCTLTRFGPKWRKAFHPRVESESAKIQTLKSSGTIKLQGTLDQATQKLESTLKARHFRTRQTSHEGRVSILAQKKIAGLFGSDIVHVGLLIILAGRRPDPRSSGGRNQSETGQIPDRLLPQRGGQGLEEHSNGDRGRTGYPYPDDRGEPSALVPWLHVLPEQLRV